MPGSAQYPSDRVAQKSYEKGPVKSGLPAKGISGNESMKTGRAGKGK